MFIFSDAAGLLRKNQAMTTIGVTLVLTADAQNDPELEHRAIRSFFAHRVADLIIAPVGNDLGYLTAEAAIVFVDSPPPGTTSQSGARMAGGSLSIIFRHAYPESW